MTLRLSLGAIALVYLICFGLLGFWIGPFDYDHLGSYYELAWRFWNSGHGLSLPHWNPYFCGGRTLGGDPQIPIFHPFILFVPLVGAVWWIKLELLGQLLLGAWALWRCLERWDVSVEGRQWGCFLYAASGAVVSRFMVGHVTMGFYLLYPLFFWLSYQLAHRWNAKWGVAYGLLFIYSGLYKPNFLIYGVPPLLFEVAVRSYLTKNSRPLIYFVMAVALCGLANAVVYLPAWRHFDLYPRLHDSGSKWISSTTFLANLLFPLKAVPEWLYGAHFMQRHEYSVFVGPVALCFVYRGWQRFRASSYRREAMALLSFGVFSLLLGMGGLEEGWTQFFPFRWLYPVWPGFQSIRVPVRFWYGAFLVIVWFSAIGFRVPKTRAGYFGWLLLGIVPLWIAATVNLGKTVVLAESHQWQSSRAYPSETEWIQGTIDAQFHPIRKGQGVLQCIANVEVEQSSAMGEGPQLPAGVTAVHWNRYRVDSGEARVEVQLNHSPFWVFEGRGAEIVSKSFEPLALQATGGRIEGELVYTQPLVGIGAVVSFLTLVFLGGWGIFFRN